MKTFPEGKWDYVGIRENEWHAFRSKPASGREPEIVLVKRARYLHVDGTSTYYNYINGEVPTLNFPVRHVKFNELPPALKRAVLANRGCK